MTTDDTYTRVVVQLPIEIQLNICIYSTAYVPKRYWLEFLDIMKTISPVLEMKISYSSSKGVRPSFPRFPHFNGVDLPLDLIEDSKGLLSRFSMSWLTIQEFANHIEPDVIDKLLSFKPENVEMIYPNINGRIFLESSFYGDIPNWIKTSVSMLTLDQLKLYELLQCINDFPNLSKVKLYFNTSSLLSFDLDALEALVRNVGSIIIENRSMMNPFTSVNPRFHKILSENPHITVTTASLWHSSGTILRFPNLQINELIFEHNLHNHQSLNLTAYSNLKRIVLTSALKLEDITIKNRSLRELTCGSNVALRTSNFSECMGLRSLVIKRATSNDFECFPSSIHFLDVSQVQTENEEKFYKLPRYLKHLKCKLAHLKFFNFMDCAHLTTLSLTVTAHTTINEDDPVWQELPETINVISIKHEGHRVSDCSTELGINLNGLTSQSVEFRLEEIWGMFVNTEGKDLISLINKAEQFKKMPLRGSDYPLKLVISSDTNVTVSWPYGSFWICAPDCNIENLSPSCDQVTTIKHTGHLDTGYTLKDYFMKS